MVVDASAGEATEVSSSQLSVDKHKLASIAQPLNASVDVAGIESGTMSVEIESESETLFESIRTVFADAKVTMTWQPMRGREPVADGKYTLRVVAESDSGSRNVSTSPISVDNTPPELEVVTNQTILGAGIKRLPVTVEYKESVTAIDGDSVRVFENGSDVTEAAQVTGTNVIYNLTGLEPGDSKTITVGVENTAGLEATRNITYTVDTNEESSSEDSDSDSPNQSGDDDEQDDDGPTDQGGTGGEPSGSPPVYDVDLTVENDRVTVGEHVTIETTVRNQGTRRGVFTAIVSIGGRTEARQEVILDGKSSKTVSLNHSFSRPGEYEVSVGSRTSLTISVVAEETMEPTTESTPATSRTRSKREPTTATPEPENGTSTVPETVTSAAPAQEGASGTTTGSGAGFGVVMAIVALAVIVGWRS